MMSSTAKKVACVLTGILAGSALSINSIKEDMIKDSKEIHASNQARLEEMVHKDCQREAISDIVHGTYGLGAFQYIEQHTAEVEDFIDAYRALPTGRSGHGKGYTGDFIGDWANAASSPYKLIVDIAKEKTAYDLSCFEEGGFTERARLFINAREDSTPEKGDTYLLVGIGLMGLMSFSGLMLMGIGYCVDRRFSVFREYDNKS